ncbi:cytochrome ubiquinol oxidase subunit I [bacterium]|nr:cytochrome ubiquinol oxidase subunit I [bacterium]
MNYPQWIIEGVGGPGIIGIIAVSHVFISQFAVGGGLFLPITEYLARRNNDPEMLEYLHTHTRFFTILTSVVGAMFGVGIWFAIGLVHPDATAFLIRNFVLAWTIEWVWFFLEILSLIVYYYGWKTLSPRTHMMVGWVYMFTAIMTLVTINGILCFMLTPGDWIQNQSFWSAMFNPTYWPSLLMRFLVCLALAGLYGLITAARMSTANGLRTRMLQYSARWFIPTFVFMLFAMGWYMLMLPEETRNMLFSGMSGFARGNFAILTRISMLTILFTATMGFMIFFGAYANPEEFGGGKIAFLMISALFVTGAGEWTREVLRKPYVIHSVMYSNALLAADAKDMETAERPFLPRIEWRKDGESDGQAMFRTQCRSCHTLDGYRPLREFLKGRDEKSILSLLKIMRPGEKNPYRNIMPPTVGTDTELAMLARYLTSEVSSAK